MRRLALALALFTAVPFAPHGRAAGADAGLGLEVSVPGAGDYDLFEPGYGLNFAFRRWCTDQTGYQLGIGYTQWDAGDGERVGSRLTDFSGDALAVPFGLSALFRAAELPVALELGLRYVLMESDLEAVNLDAGESAALDIEDSVIGLVAVHTDWELSASTRLGVDLGYQFDVSPGEVDSRFGDAGEVELQSFFLRVGLRWPL